MGTILSAALPTEARDNEAKLLEHLEREHNPVKRAKLEVRLAKLNLDQAIESYQHEDFSICMKSLNAYLERMKDAWAVLESSGRQATRKPQGFRKLEITLRESQRKLVDFENQVSYLQRQKVQKVRVETEQLHNRVITALFPGMVPPKKKPKVAGPKPPSPTDPQEPR